MLGGRLTRLRIRGLVKEQLLFLMLGNGSMGMFRKRAQRSFKWKVFILPCSQSQCCMIILYRICGFLGIVTALFMSA